MVKLTQFMDFKELRELHAIVKALNANKFEAEIKVLFPHMYLDGKWSVTYCFNRNPDLVRMAPILSFCLANNLDAFFGNLNGGICLFVQ